MLFGCQNECEKIGLKKSCVVVGQHEESYMQLIMITPDGVPIFMPTTHTVNDYACECVERKDFLE